MVEYKGIQYPTIEIDIKGWTRTISTESLIEALLPDGSTHDSEEAEDIDDGIFFYVPDRMINAPDKQIREYIEANL